MFPDPPTAHNTPNANACSTVNGCVLIRDSGYDSMSARQRDRVAGTEVEAFRRQTG